MKRSTKEKKKVQQQQQQQEETVVPSKKQDQQQSEESSSSSSTQLQFTALYGAHTPTQPTCYLLEVSGVKVLLDCGWDSTWDLDLLDPLARVCPEIKLVLISHASIEHVGALPFAISKLKLRAPVYMTSPVVKLAHLACYDAVLSGAAPYTLDDVDGMMEQIHELKYQQPLDVTLGEGKENIVVRCHASGRTLGGAVWRVFQEPSLNVLYASDVLQRRERYLDGLDLKALGKGPTLLIQDALGVSTVRAGASASQKVRDADTLEICLKTLRSGGDVLIPVDSTGRAFEVLLLLDEKWIREMLDKTYDLVFYTRISSVFDVASTHMEWCSRQLQAQLDVAVHAGKSGGEDASAGGDPFRVSKILVADNFEDAFSSPRPRVVVCVDVDLARGTPAREVFVRRIAGNPSSCVLLVVSSLVLGSVARQLMGGARVVTMDEEQWVDLDGEELVEWQMQRRVKLEEQERERLADAEMKEFEEDARPDVDGSGATTTIPGPTSSTSSAMPNGSASASSATGNVTTTPASAVPAMMMMTTGDEGPTDGAPMFSFRAPDTRGDEYGGFVDEDALMDNDARAVLREEKKKNETTPTTGNEAATDADASEEDGAAAEGGERTNEEELKTLVDEGDNDAPRKKVRVPLTIPVQCRVYFMDFGGRPSATDLFEIVDIIKPKKLVVVRADLQDSERFASECQTRGACAVGLFPSAGDTVDVAADSSVVRLRVPEETLQTLPPSVRVGEPPREFEVQRVRARITLTTGAAAAAAATTTPQQQPEKRRRVVAAGGELPSILPPADVTEKLAGDGECWWISRGEPSLVDVKDRLKSKGVSSRFHDAGSVLLCGPLEEVLVWKPQGGGRLMVSGPLCEAYFDIRNLVYGSFALI